MLTWHSLWPEGRPVRTASNPQAPCQAQLMDDWGSVLAHEGGYRHLVAHAPTGLGKTAGALVPALAWVAERPQERQILYLVNRIIQHVNPLEELNRGLAGQFQKASRVPLRVIDLVGRTHLCSYPEEPVMHEVCKVSRDDARFERLPGGVPSWQEVKAHLPSRYCPYHFLQGLMSKAHLVICDYWWVFSRKAQNNPRVRETLGISPRDTILIVDEAHQLPGRVRSESAVDCSITKLIETVKALSPESEGPFRAFTEALVELEGEAMALPDARAFLGGGELVRLRSRLASLDSRSRPAGHVTVSNLVDLLAHDDPDTIILHALPGEKNDDHLFAQLLDPFPILERGFQMVHASLCMSGTLASPADSSEELRYQVPLLGLPVQVSRARTYASPFPLLHQQWAYCTDTLGTAKFREGHVTRYALHIQQLGTVTPGITAAFFSSYAFLQMVLEALPDPERDLVVFEARDSVQDSGIAEVEQRLRDKVALHGRGYLFAIYQGQLAEGANFTNNLVRTVVAVSIPIEVPSLYHDRLEGLFLPKLTPVAQQLGDDPARKSREYARDRLSLSLVLQACGRGIRSATDHCAFVLLDKRYRDMGWRRFLEPRPYELSRPAETVARFHTVAPTSVQGNWDPALLRFIEKPEA